VSNQETQEATGHGDISVGVAGAGASGDGSASATRITPGNALRPEDIALEVRTGLARPTEDVAEYALRLGDDALILAQRLGHWISRAPELEEDVAWATSPWTSWATPGASSATPPAHGTKPRMTSPTSAASTSSAPRTCSSSPTGTSPSPSPGSSW
jgi:hypothetical protein